MVVGRDPLCTGWDAQDRKEGEEKSVINLMPRYDSDRHRRNTFDFTSLQTENTTSVYVSGAVLAIPLDHKAVGSSLMAGLTPIQYS